MRKKPNRLLLQFVASGAYLATLAAPSITAVSAGEPAVQRRGTVRVSRQVVPRQAPQSRPSPIRLTSADRPEPTVAEPEPAPDEFIKPEAATDWTTIDLPSALQLAGVENPQVAIAYQRVLATTAAQQFAAAQWLPNLNAGTNYDAHQGVLQQASGNILTVNRNSLYVGAGANAVAAGSVNIPGIQYNLNVSQSIYTYLISQQITEQSRFANQAIRNEVQQQVATAYGSLIRAEGQRAIAYQSRGYARELTRVTKAYAKTGQGREADAERAATELARREADLLAQEANALTASAQLSQLLFLDSSTRLHPHDQWAVPRVIVPLEIALPELLTMALYQRPELGERRAAVHAAMLELDGARMLPFSPQIIAGYSGGVFGGGSDLVASDRTPRFGAPVNQPRFGSFAPRDDVDVVAYWSLQNLGLGNKALIDSARARLNESDYERLAVLNRIRAEVADAYARVQTLQAQFETRRQAVETSRQAFKQDFIRTRQAEGLPIEVLSSLRQFAQARIDFLNSIVDYNAAQFQLYTALGQPPIDMLVRPAENENGP